MIPSKTGQNIWWKGLAFLVLLIVPMPVWAAQGNEKKKEENPPPPRPQVQQQKPQVQQQRPQLFGPFGEKATFPADGTKSYQPTRLGPSYEALSASRAPVWLPGFFFTFSRFSNTKTQSTKSIWLERGN